MLFENVMTKYLTLKIKWGLRNGGMKNEIDE